MRAAEFETTVLAEGKIDVPESLRDVLPNQPVRVIVLWGEKASEEGAWQELSLDIFREGDGPYDALYDNL